jgi:hypothetical protein
MHKTSVYILEKFTVKKKLKKQKNVPSTGVIYSSFIYMCICILILSYIISKYAMIHSFYSPAKKIAAVVVLMLIRIKQLSEFSMSHAANQNKSADKEHAKKESRLSTLSSTCFIFAPKIHPVYY